MENKNNLLRIHSWWNCYAIEINFNCYELNNIIIYNENGILIETSQGWFNESNNTTQNNYIGEVKKISVSNIDKNMKQKNNFIVKDSQYNNESRYVLYIYYKNVNYKFVGLTLDYFLQINYTLFNNDSKKYQKAIGMRSTKSSNIKHNEISPIIKEMEYFYKIEDLENNIKKLNKTIKKYKKMLEWETNLTTNSEELEEIFYNGEETQKQINNNKNLMEG